MYDIVIYEPDTRYRKTLEGILSQLKEDTRSISFASNPQDCYRLARLLRPSVLLMSVDEEQEGDADFYLNQIAEKLPAIRRVLLLDESHPGNVMKILRRRNETFLFKPYDENNCLAVLSECMMQVAMRPLIASLEDPEISCWQEEHSQAALHLSRYLAGGDTLEDISRDLSCSGLTFGKGAVALSPLDLPRSLRRERRKKLHGMGIHLFEVDQPEYQLCLLVISKQQANTLSNTEELITDCCKKNRLYLFTGDFVSEPYELKQSFRHARLHWIESGQLLPAARIPCQNPAMTASVFSIALDIAILTGEDNEVKAVCRWMSRAHDFSAFWTRFLPKIQEDLADHLKQAFSLTEEDVDLIRAYPMQDQLTGREGTYKALLTYCMYCRKLCEPYLEDLHHNHLGRMVSHICEQSVSPTYSLNHLSDHLSLSPGYICFLFRSVFPFSFTEYLNYCRIYRSLLLLEEDLSIKSVASRSGFQSNTYFGKVFKSLTGLTPSEYRFWLRSTRQ